MFDRLRRWLPALLLKTPVLIGLGVVLAYLLAGWFAFEPLVKWAAPRFIADKSQHQLSLVRARFDPLGLAVRLEGVKLAEPDGKPLLDLDELVVDFQATSLFRWAWTFDLIRLGGPNARLVLRPDGRLNWSALLEAFEDEEEEPDKPLPRLLVRRIELAHGRVEVADRRVDFATALNPLDLVLTDLSTLPDETGAYNLSATTQMGARIRWKGEVTLKPVQATGELAVDRLPLERAWPYLETRLNMAPPKGTAALGLKYRVGWADRKLSLLVDDLGLAVEGLVLAGLRAPEPAVVLDRLALVGGRLDLARRTLDMGEITLNGGRVHLQRDATGRLDVQDWFAGGEVGGKRREAPPADPAPAPKAGGKGLASAAAEPPWQVTLARFSLDGLGVQWRDAGFVTPLTAQVGNVKLGFKASAQAGAGAPQVRVDDLALDLSGLRLVSGGDPAGPEALPLVVLGGISVEDGQLDLAARQARVARVMLSNGKVEAERDAQGALPLVQAFQPVAATAPSAPLATPPAQGTDPGGWNYRLDRLELTGFQVTGRDHTVAPAASLTLQDITASVEGLSQDMKAPLPVKLGFRVREGGRFEAAGQVVPGKPQAEVKLKLADLALAPIQPYLDKYTNLVLQGGRVSTAGQVRYADGRGQYAGGMRADDLLLKEASSGERFLSWKSVSTDALKATQAGLEVGELRVDQLGMKMVIFKDKTTSLAKAFQKEAASPPKGGETGAGEAEQEGNKGAGDMPAIPSADAPATTAKPRAPAAQAAAPPAYPVDIERLRVRGGEMDFADLSLALPFGTRVHELQGYLNGISNRPGGHAQLEVDGRVDEFGLARAVGQADMFNPTGNLDIKVVFQNVEMTRLTPYTATFVGRRIDSGKLSLNLEYKIQERQLLGENQIIMNRLVLGERVESPTAKDLPLDLAIAILEDSNGVIDLDLPVSGSLDDPQFSYGRIIWKAIGNIIVKLVTAPFRALGKLFGGGGEQMEKVAFEVGDTGLTPPEREKLKRLAEGLGKRPGLVLTVGGTYDPETERPVLKEQDLRRQVAEAMGLKLAPGEEPGPVSTAQPKAQVALEALYARAFGAEAWQSLRARHAQANPEKQPEKGAAGKLLSRLSGLFKDKPQPLTEAELAELKGTDLYVMVYQRLLERVEVTDARLADLGRARGEAIRDQVTAMGLPVGRVRLDAPVISQADGRSLQVKLGLAAGPKPAATPTSTPAATPATASP